MFELDGRVVRSFRAIVIHPGQLSLAFLENQRANFVNPFRLFMFTTILWFFLFGLTIPTPEDQRATRGDRPHKQSVEFDIGIEDKEQRRATIEDGLQIIEELMEPARLNQFHALLQLPDEQRRDGPLNFVAQLLVMNPELPIWFQELLANLVVATTYSPQLVINQITDNLPLMMVFLLPWYSLLLMMFYAKRGKRFVHHLVFAIHVHAFSFIVLSIAILTPGQKPNQESSVMHQIWEIFDLCLIVALMVHTYFAFKRFYGEGHPRTLFKVASLGVLYSLGLIPAFSLILLLSIAEYF